MLTDNQKFYHNASLSWSKEKAQITFKNDGSVSCSGDRDYGYTHWELMNDQKDIRVAQGTIGYDTLRS